MTEELKPQKYFYMIFVESAQSPTKKYFLLDEAKAEAERLAIKTGRETYILKAVEMAKMDNVKFTSLV